MKRYKLNDKVMIYGRPAYIVGIQYGCRLNSGQMDGIFYDLSRDLKKREVEFRYIHESQVKPFVEAEAPKREIIQAETSYPHCDFPNPSIFKKPILVHNR